LSVRSAFVSEITDFAKRGRAEVLVKLLVFVCHSALLAAQFFEKRLSIRV
jgi:hypothetical protein